MSCPFPFELQPRITTHVCGLGEHAGNDLFLRDLNPEVGLWHDFGQEIRSDRHLCDPLHLQTSTSGHQCLVETSFETQGKPTRIARSPSFRHFRSAKCR